MELFTQLWHNTDTYDSALARHVLAGRYTWLEEGVIDPSIPGPWIASAEPDHCAARHNGRDRGACRPRQRSPFSAKVGLGEAREELGAIAGIVEWARAGCWQRASLG